MRLRPVVVVVLLISPLLVGPAQGSVHTPWDTSAEPFCPVCGEAALGEATNATFERSTVEIRVDRNGSGHWTVRNRLAANSTVVDHDALREVASRLVDGHQHASAAGDVSVTVENRTVTVRFIDPEFAEPTAGGTFTVQYYVREHYSYGPSTYNADEITVRAPHGYRAVGPVGEGQERDDVVRFDAATRDAYEETGTRMVFARGPLATVGGPLGYDLGRSDIGLEYGTFVGVLLGVAFVASPMIFWITATVPVGSRYLDRRPRGPSALGGYVAAGLAFLAVVALGELAEWRSEVYFGAFAGLAALYGAVAVGTVVKPRWEGRVSLVQFGVAAVLVLASLRLGFDGVVAAMVVGGGLTSLGAAAAIGDADWWAAIGHVVVAIGAMTVALLLTFVFLDGLGAVILFGVVVVVGPVTLVPAMLVGVVYGAPWRRGKRAAEDLAAD